MYSINNICFVLIISVIMAFSSCGSKTNEVKTAENKDSLAFEQMKAVKNEILLSLEPPDTNYTGDHIVKYPNGVIRVKGYFRFGKRHSKWMYFFENGNLQTEADYLNGVMQGEEKVYYPNGNLMYSGIQKNDKSVGKWIYNDSLGKPYRYVIYDTLGNVVKEELIK